MELPAGNMLQANALSVTPSVRDWLVNSHRPRVLYVFDRACNLIDERGEVLSVVTQETGNGPFNLVVGSDILFDEHFPVDTPILNSANRLNLGNLTIHAAGAKLWDPRPDWELLHAKRDGISHRLTEFQTIARHPPGLGFLEQGGAQFSNAMITSLSSALVNADSSTAKEVTSKLAGLGAGLTPSGDDIIMGALYAAWIVHPVEVASRLALEVAETTAPVTTSLSAAWIRTAGRGEAGEVWHRFFEALCEGAEAEIQRCIDRILSVGETSGADALAGFTGTMTCWVEQPSSGNSR